MSKLIVGCGYLGRRVGARWVEQGHEVFATTRSPERANELRRAGLRPVVADVTRPETLSALPPADTVLYAVGFDRSSGVSRHEVYAEGLRAVLDALDPDVTRRVIFISSTGVYGDPGGEWVYEDSPCHPESEGGQAFLAGEQILGRHPLGERSTILRMAGIYGPDRVPKAEELRAGKPVAVAAGGSVNLIHVDDAAAAVLAAEARAEPPRVYLISDGHPVERREFYTHLAEVLGCGQPRFVEPLPEQRRIGRGGGDKRVRNRRILQELGVQLTYPTYREGLAGIYGEDSG
jgi:nucleoside-diphosphate-sugar epimerase